MVNFKNLFKRKPDERVDALIQELLILNSEINALKIDNERLHKEVEELKQVRNEDDGVDAQQVMDEYFRGAKGDYR
jgi:FtsZ-binding cell division protein ZapB